MEDKKRLFVVLTVVVSFVSVGLLSAALATDNWIYAESNTIYVANKTQTAEISFGLFKGFATIYYALAHRQRYITIACDTSLCLIYYSSSNNDDTSAKLQDVINQFRNDSKYNQDSVKEIDYALFPVVPWALTLTFMGLGVIFSLVYIGFAIFNVIGKPIETITGPLGLYLWNALTFILCLAAVITFAVLYGNYFKHNVISREDIQDVGFKSDATLDYSYYLIVIATLCHVINLILLLVSGVKINCPCTETDDVTKSDVMISGMY